jgi:hypothetical protein
MSLWMQWWCKPTLVHCERALRLITHTWWFSHTPMLKCVATSLWLSICFDAQHQSMLWVCSVCISCEMFNYTCMLQTHSLVYSDCHCFVVEQWFWCTTSDHALGYTVCASFNLVAIERVLLNTLHIASWCICTKQLLLQQVIRCCITHDATW